jgi:hypothetical protein
VTLHGGDEFFVFNARACGECWDGLLLPPPPPPPPLLLPLLFGTRVHCTRGHALAVKLLPTISINFLSQKSVHAVTKFKPYLIQSTNKLFCRVTSRRVPACQRASSSPLQRARLCAAVRASSSEPLVFKLHLNLCCDIVADNCFVI